MRITTQGVYGLVCVLRIAQQVNSYPISIQTISNKEQLSVDYIEQLLLKLRKAGIIKSIRGRIGGYVLARQSSKITVKDIVEAVEGNIFDTICFGDTHHRKDKTGKIRGCLVRPIWVELKKIIEDYLKGITIKDLLESKK